MVNAALQLFAASSVMTMMVLAEIAHTELQDPTLYREVWIRYRDRLWDVIRFVPIQHRCDVTNGIMKLAGWPRPR